jgi:uncharacterized lipoprotein NlpE involved in copper resistance
MLQAIVVVLLVLMSLVGCANEYDACIEKQKAAGKTHERMRKPGTKGAPTAAAFKAAAKTAKK